METSLSTIRRETLGETDGFRDVFTEEAGPGRMNAETITRLTTAILDHDPEMLMAPPVIVARDTRPSSEELLAAAIAGAAERQSGNVINLGVAPTPAAQKIGNLLGGASATIVITASHNAEEFNGWKGMIGNNKLTEAQMDAIGERYWQLVDQNKPIRKMTSPAVKHELLQRYTDAVVEDIRETFGPHVLGDKMVVVDDANGAARHVTAGILRRLGANAVEFRPSSRRINDGCGAADLSGLEQFLSERPYLAKRPGFLGAVANDGDGDRMMAIGMQRHGGVYHPVTINGNHTMWAMAQGEPGIVGTIYTNSGLRTKLRENNIGFQECANGDRYVTEKLRQLQKAGMPWKRGGEFTGHTIDLDWLPSGDGVRSAAWLAAYAASRGMTFTDLYEEMPLWHEAMVKVKLASKIGKVLVEHELVQQTIAQAQDQLGDRGRFIVRASGTEPVIRVWGESAQNPRVLNALVVSIQESVRRAAEEHQAIAA